MRRLLLLLLPLALAQDYGPSLEYESCREDDFICGDEVTCIGLEQVVSSKSHRLFTIFQVCDGIADCPLGEASPGGEDEAECDFSGDYSDYSELAEGPNQPPILAPIGQFDFDSLVDVGREPPSTANFVDVGTEPPIIQNFFDVGTEPTNSQSFQEPAPSFQSRPTEETEPSFQNFQNPPDAETESVSLEDMCHLSTGQSNIVLDMFESFGDDFNQQTSPAQLPILGTVGRDIELDLVFNSGNSIFR